jgi:hypothetical protein
MILTAFVKFSEEAAIVGRLLAGYTVLEIGLLNCVQMGVGNFDTVLKGLFQIRGEARRINAGEALGRPVYQGLSLDTDFDEAIAAIRHCRLIRNQYAHCNWWDDNSGKLAFANLEDAAKDKTAVPDLLDLLPEHVDVPLLQSQEAFYKYTDDLLAYVNYEGRTRAGKPSGPVAKPTPKSPPPLHL